MQQNYQVKRFQHNQYVLSLLSPPPHPPLYFLDVTVSGNVLLFQNMSAFRNGQYVRWKPACVHRMWFCFKETAVLQQILLQFQAGLSGRAV